MPGDTFNYSNSKMTIAWKPDVCIRSGICARGQVNVYDPK
jgi:uncharacterized Fe-S cluster protein YjdI